MGYGGTTLMFSWNTIIQGGAIGLRLLSDIDTYDQRSAVTKRAIGMSLHLRGCDQALRNAFHRGYCEVAWDRPICTLPEALQTRCVDMVHDHRAVTTHFESAVMRAIQLEFDILLDIATQYPENTVNEYIRQLVCGLTEPVFWNGDGNDM